MNRLKPKICMVGMSIADKPKWFQDDIFRGYDFTE